MVGRPFGSVVKVDENNLRNGTLTMSGLDHYKGQYSQTR